MRSVFILSGLVLILSSCASKDPIDHGPGFCDINCSTPTVKVDLSNLPASELSKAILKRFVADGSYTNIIDTTKGHPFTVSSDFDYEVVLTSGTVVTIGSI